MHALTTGLALAIAVNAGSLRETGTVAESSTCSDDTEVLSVAPHGTLPTGTGTDTSPVYEVKYRYCGRIHRLLIQVPDDDVGSRQTIFKPMFF